MRGRGGSRLLLIAVAIIGAGVLAASAFVWSIREPAPTTPAQIVAVAHTDAAGATDARLTEAVSWVDGLAAGRILPSDVESRLTARDAKNVTSAWLALRSLSNSRALEDAVGWIDGLAAGRILPSDVGARLTTHHPKTASVVSAAWSDLASNR